MNESIGAIIGLSNVMTAARARVAPGPALDGQDALRQRVRSRALRALEGREAFIQDAFVAGRRVRLFTNSHHLADFWKENLPGEGDWRERNPGAPPAEPALRVHAAVGVAGEAEASYADARRAEVYLLNTSYYGDLRACTMEALARVIGAEGRLVHGAALQAGSRGIALLYPKELILPTPTWGIMELPDARFIADGWFLLDREGRLRALEKGVYFRACTVASYPALIPKLLMARFENVGTLAPADLERQGPAAQEILDGLRESDPSGRMSGLPSERGREMILRLTSGRDARCLLSASVLFGASRLADGVRVDAAFRLLAGKGGPLAVPEPVDGFPCPGYALRPEMSTGHPREVARLIART
jgi:hypothetical protein